MTLIEMMIALFLSVLILGTMITIYLTVVQNQEEQMALIKMGEQSRSMMQPLTTELHLAGDFICQKNPMQMIKPYHDQEIKKGTEGFTIEYIDPHSVKLIEMQNDHNLLVTNEQLFKEGDQLVLTDCKTYDIFTVQSVVKSGMNQLIVTDQKLTKHYEQNSEMSQFHQASYFIKQTNRKDKKGEFIDALYIKNQQKNEWVEGVDDLKIVYDLLEADTVYPHQEEELNEHSHIVGIYLIFKFKSLGYFSLEKTEYLYVSLQ